MEAEDVESSEREDACDCCGGKVFCMGRGQEGRRCDRRIAVNAGVHSRRACHRRCLGGAGTGSALFTRLADRVYRPLIGLVPSTPTLRPLPAQARRLDELRTAGRAVSPRPAGDPCRARTRRADGAQGPWGFPFRAGQPAR